MSADAGLHPLGEAPAGPFTIPTPVKKLDPTNGKLRRKVVRKDTRGFTLIELLIVVVIIGILAAIAIPKFAATKDKAKLASVKTDLRNMMTAEEAYFSDYATYGTFAQLQTASNYTLSSGNTGAAAAAASGFTATVTNTSITSVLDQCEVQVGAGVASTLDGVIVCS